MIRKALAVARGVPIGVIVGIIANFYTYRVSLWPFNYAEGAVIRPMFEGMLAGIIVLLALLVGVPLSLWDIRRGWRAHRRNSTGFAVIGLLLSLTPWPFGLYLVDYFAMQRHLTFEQ